MIDQSEKKKNIAIVIILIIVVLFGIGLYFFLKYAKDSMIKDKTVKLNSKLSTNIDDYMKNTKNCTLDLSEVNTSKKGKYKYYVKCKRKTYEATIEVK